MTEGKGVCGVVVQRCWAGDRRDEDGRDRAQVGNSGALFAAFITSWSWNQHGEHGPLRLVDGDGGMGRSEGGGEGRVPSSNLSSLSAFPDTHQLCHHYLGLPRHASRDSCHMRLPRHAPTL